MLDALKAWQNRFNFRVEMIDIDDDSALTQQYAARIPLLVDGDVEICHYHFDEHRLLNHFKNTD